MRQLSRSWTSLVLSLMVTFPVASEAKKKEFDVESLLAERTPAKLIAPLKDKLKENVQEDWRAAIVDSSALTATSRVLYPNPMLQTYVNRLGQSLVPADASDEVFLSFRIIFDPLPYADALPTGVVQLSTGLLSLVENESQLAFLLMHEAGHVLLAHHVMEIILANKGERRAKRIAAIGAIAGAAAGVYSGDNSHQRFSGGVVGGYGGLLAGYGIAGGINRFRERRYNAELQKESDRFAGEVIMHRGFDPREAPAFLNRIAKIIKGSSPAAGLAFGSGPDLRVRSGKIRAFVNDDLKIELDHVLDGEGFKMASPQFNELMAVLKRDNGQIALAGDYFAIAKANLEEAAAIKTDDPVTMFALGQLYHQIARTDEDLAKATRYLRAAMDFDELRHRFPEAYLQYAVELLSREDTRLFSEIQTALKSYVVFYQRKNGGLLPPEIQFVYDQLSRTGDTSWVAFEVRNTSTSVPYQLTGNPDLDHSVSDSKALQN